MRTTKQLIRFPVDHLVINNRTLPRYSSNKADSFHNNTFTLRLEISLPKLFTFSVRLRDHTKTIFHLNNEVENRIYLLRLRVSLER